MVRDRDPVRPPRHGLARVLSRMGTCSRSEAARRISAGRVRVNGAVVRDPELPCDPTADRIELDGVVLRVAERVCVMLNKPRGLVVSASDEQGRDTVYGLLHGAGLPWLAPAGRLDKASEGLLLMSNLKCMVEGGFGLGKGGGLGQQFAFEPVQLGFIKTVAPVLNCR